MKTEAEVRELLADLGTYDAASPQQQIGLAASMDALRWVLGDMDAKAEEADHGQI